MEENRQLWREVPGAYVTDYDYVEYNGITVDKYDLEDIVRKWLRQDYEDMTGLRWTNSTDIIDEFEPYYLQNCLNAYCNRL